VALIAFLSTGIPEPVEQKKKFYFIKKKLILFSFKCLTPKFFWIIFFITASFSVSESGSDPAKTFGFYCPSQKSNGNAGSYYLSPHLGTILGPGSGPS
jgi:hypothetical protein